MLDKSKAAARTSRIYQRADDASIADFAALTASETRLEDWPHAAAVDRNVLIYDSPSLLPRLTDPQDRRDLLAEWADALMTGPGVVVLKGAEPDHAMLDAATALFFRLIEEQNRSGTGGGDHFAKPGANDRIWNSLQKHAESDPANFVAYYANPFLAAISEAWLGPAYQITAQLNVVNPGGAAQSPHRDYHLGFASAAQIERYPLHVQLLSPVLTLQGAIAHIDTPLETGPTLLLPHSQRYPAGYLAMGLPAFKDHFATHHVQLPLQKGDMLFFSPALFHAAGSNRSADVRRMVNLFQVSSAYGRAMETVDRTAMCKAVYPALLSRSLSPEATANVIAATAEGYSFPTNLDRDPPIGGMAPRTQAALMAEALAERLSPAEFDAALEAHANRRLA
jgi:ectoine hydroxylase-related dioxygenase (phytanoyl-CoA dioxygenase family)